MFYLKRKGLFTVSMIVLMLLALVPTHWALATSSSYSSTVSTATVGTAAGNMIQYNKGGDGTYQIWADWSAGAPSVEILMITLPDNYPVWSSLTYTVEWDTDTTNNASGETAISAGTTIGTYVVNNRVMGIKWNATSWATLAALRVVITAGFAPDYEATLNIAFSGATASGADTDPSSNLAIVASAASANATLALAGNSVVAASGATTLSLTAPSVGASGDKFIFTAPANLNVTGATYSSDTFGTSKFSGCTNTSGQIITCTTNAAITAGAGTIVMTGITSKYAATSQTITSISITDSSNNVRASGTSGVVSNDTTAAVANASATLAGNAVVGVSGDTTLTITTPLTIAEGGTIVFVAPANLNVASAAYSSDTFGAGENFTAGTGCAAVGQVITCTVKTGGSLSATTGNIVLTGIQAAYANAIQSTGIAGLAIKEATVAGVTASSTAAVPETTAAVANASATLAGNSVVGASGNTVFTVNVPVAIASGGTIVFTAPANLNVSGATYSTSKWGAGATFISGCGVSTQTITCTVGSAGLTADSVGTLTFTGITSKYAATSQTVTSISVTTNGTLVAASGTSGSLTNTTQANAAGVLALAGNSVVGASGNTTLTITTPLTIAEGGTIVFVAPANLNVASAAYSSDTFGAGENFTAGTGCAAVGQVITCTVKNGKSLSATTGNIVLTGIKAAYVNAIQSTGIAGLAIKEATVAGVTASSTAAVPETTVGALSGPMILPNNSVAGTIGTIKINFTTVTTIPNLGKIVIVAPSQFNVSGVNGTTASALSGLDGTWTAAVSGQTITLTQTSGTATTAGAKSLTLSSVQNTQAAAGSFAGAFSITTKTAASENIETVNSTNRIEILYGGNNTSAQYFAVNTPVVTFVPPSTAVAPVVTTTPATAVKPLPTPAPIAAPTTIQDLLIKPSFNVVQAKSAVNSISQDKSIAVPTTGTPTCTANSLVKGTTNKTVYYCGNDSKRYVFPNEKTYKTWFVDFSNVSQVSDTDLSKIPLGGNATYKPGVKLIKIQTDPKVYVVAPGGVLRWIGSEILAAKYYGTNWNKQIDDVSDAFFTNYKIGIPITE